MSDLVPTEDIERIVGTPRRSTQHMARAVSAEQTVYILHSRDCLESGRDLRECPFSLALDNGIRLREWEAHQDEPVPVSVRHPWGDEPRLVPDVHAQ